MVKKKRAFTLIELLLAATLMSIIFTVVLGIAASVLSTWNKTSGELKAISQGNVMLKMIQEDFECMVVKNDGGAWLQVAYPDNVGMLTGTNVSYSSSSTTPLRPPEIMFYSAPIDRPRYTSDEISEDAYSRTPIAGSLCAMKYQVAVKSPFLKSWGNASEDANKDNAFYGFYRAIMDPKATFENALGEEVQGNALSPDTSYQDISDKLYSFWNGKSSQVLGEGGTYSTQVLKAWALAPENLLGLNVVDFRATFTIKYLNPNNTDTYDNYSYATIAPGTPFTLGDRLYVEKNLYTRNDSGSLVATVDPDNVENASLAYVDVSITILTEQGYKRMLGLMEKNNINQSKFKEIVAEDSITVVKRITFIGDSI